MLADAPTGVSEEVLVVAYGFSAEMLAGLVLAALARVVTETRTVRRGFTTKIQRYRITDDGRRGRMPTRLPYLPAARMCHQWPRIIICMFICIICVFIRSIAHICCCCMAACCDTRILVLSSRHWT